MSDLTYVKVGGKWHYTCLLVDLFNREIIGFSAGPKKNVDLVYKALASVKIGLDAITLFHTDRGNEFKNRLIDEVLKTFNIKRSLSAKGCPYDNAVAEATFKLFKTEFANNYHFSDLEQLEIMLADYVNWFNTIRIQSTLDYLSPREYRLHNLKKVVWFGVDDPLCGKSGSKSFVSSLTKELDGMVETWRNSSLEGTCSPYLMVDVLFHQSKRKSPCSVQKLPCSYWYNRGRQSRNYWFSHLGYRK